jgi:hypothetical protein
MDQTQSSEGRLKSQHNKQTGVPHAPMRKEPPIRHLVAASSQDRWRRSANAAWGEFRSRWQEWPELHPQRSILIGFFPQSQVPQSNCEPTAPRAHGMSESDVFSQPAIARPFPHSHWAFDDCSCLRKSCVQVENAPLTTSNKKLSRNQQPQRRWVQRLQSALPAKMTVIAAGVERHVP